MRVLRVVNCTRASTMANRHNYMAYRYMYVMRMFDVQWHKGQVWRKSSAQVSTEIVTLEYLNFVRQSTKALEDSAIPKSHFLVFLQ